MIPLRSVLLGRSSLLSSQRAYSAASPTAALDKSRFVLAYDAGSFPKGYLCSSVHTGIKKNPQALDLGLFVSKSASPTSAAACFTRNVFKAAPVNVSRDVLLDQGGRARALIVNSGCANAVTGKQGTEDALAMVRSVDSLISSDAENAVRGTLVVSTGVIGQNLPMTKILPAIPSLHDSLSSNPEAWMSLAKAFMTTDTFPKLRTRTFQLGGQEVRLAGVDKGAGMIHPSMGPPQPAKPLHGTLLGMIATDAAISPAALQSALTFAVERSFNSITVDGDMSTNDTVVAFANGASGMTSEIDESHPEYKVFRDELTSFAEELAKLVVRDGEGATKFVTITVKGAPSYEQAKTVASTIATSSLVKTALYGQDANWGRILCAIGYAPLGSPNPIEPTKTRVSFLPTDGSSELVLLDKGEPVEFSEDRASEILKAEDLEVVVDLGGDAGSAEAKYWTCDFSHEYVTINGSYRS
ncbi:arginine biosynthesis protein [Phaffia rhodozyma]|uniref:Arginine biosynthesis bifunctional protein ArgJ, mitochondrial n=1 Tax=Phaffia rhodozyma TaxID=264483 RepID=A0A0F7SVU0_PHARH|nr:arginine biosynthesis protein [Phaffia rhodozyma]